MSYTRAQLMSNTREMMDATNSQRWSDAFVRTALGGVGSSEWQGILAANPYYRFAQRSVSAGSTGLFPYTDLNSGSGDSAQTWNRILAITDGNSIVYRQTDFMASPLATSSNYQSPSASLWYDAGTNVQVLPAAAASLVVSINHTPPRIDQLSADNVTVDFPDGHESILWLEAGAYLLSKGGAENDAAQTLRAMAEQERQDMYAALARRSARPTFLGYGDTSGDWAGF